MSEEQDEDLGAALVPSKGDALSRPQEPARPPGVSAPIEGAGVSHLAMNCVVPGLGSLVAGKKGLGAAQLGAAALSIVLFLSGHFMWGILGGLAAWIWSIASGVGFLSKKQMQWK